MKTFFTTILLFLATFACVATTGITEWYVSLNGSGDGSGSSPGNSMSWTNFNDYMISGGGSFTATNGSRFNIVKDTYFVGTSNLTWNVSGVQSNLIYVRGYSTTIGDGYQGRTNGNGPLVTTNMPILRFGSGSFAIDGSYFVLESIQFTCNRNGDGLNFETGNNGYISRCSLLNSNAGSSATAMKIAQTSVTLFDSDFSLSGGTGPTRITYASTSTHRIIGCRFSGVGSADGVQEKGNLVFAFNTVYGCSNGIIVDTTGGSTFWYNTITACTNGITFPNADTAPSQIVGNAITDNALYGVNWQDGTNCSFTAYNRFRNNAGGNFNPTNDFYNLGNITTDQGGGAAQDYQAAASNDYRLISSSLNVYGAFPYPASVGANQYLTNCTGGASSPVTTSHSFVR